MKALPRRRPTLWAAVFCLLSFTGLWLAQRAAQVSMVDLMVYRAEGWAVRTGTDLYDLRATRYELPTTYPPFAALLFTPLSLPTVGVVKVLATAVNLALVAALTQLSLRLVGDRLPVPRPAAALLVAAVAVWCEPVWSTLRYGQINLLIAVLVLWDLTRRPGHRWAGVGIGIATGIKLTPALFVVFLALAGLAARRGRRTWGRRHREPRPSGSPQPSGSPRPREGLRREELRRAGVATAAFAATVALAGLVLPRDSRRFWTDVVLSADRPGDVEEAGNQNLRGVLARALHTVDPGLWWLLAAALVGCVGMAVAVGAHRAGERLPYGRAWSALACAITALLVSPVSWSHHWVWAVPVALLLCAEARRRRTARWVGGAALTGLLFCSYAIWYPPHVVPRHVELRLGSGQMLLTAAYPLLGVAFLAVAGCLTVRALRTPPAASLAPQGPHGPRARAEGVSRRRPSYARG
ncbi:glycosyltransferase 87 family protein [Streptomyces sp. LX-29]|uniref:glycosyltransferase 87 family protein n=1 Tax=Streptomyces sp. LX-29 TaxID=2900152 RepID=UPI00321B3875